MDNDMEWSGGLEGIKLFVLCAPEVLTYDKYVI